MDVQKNLKTLTMALIFSGALNISLIGAGIFTVLRDKKQSFELPKQASQEKSIETTNQQVLHQLSKLGFRELVSYLTNRDLVEEGYAKRDLAIAELVAHHHFNLEKALGEIPQQQRQIGSLTLFPGLSEEQYEAVIRFAYQEKWPLTAQGLFHILKSTPKPRDASLEQAFYLTPEFYSLLTLFQKTETLIPSDRLLDLICEGSWDLLRLFTNEQEQLLDLSVEKRRRILLSYLALQSSTAGQLLLMTDFSFALKRLEDSGIVALLKILTQTPEAERFCAELLQSARSNAVQQTAVEKLYAFAKESLPIPLDLVVAKRRFVKEELVQASPKTDTSSLPVKPPTRIHVVKDKESLWKIAKSYKVPVDEIVKLNGLEKDRIYPGMNLKIPTQGTGSQPPR